jgi:V/A-type H+-transporting ATPase subunit F
VKIIIVGNKDECLGFSLAGVEPKIVENEKDFIITIKTLLKDSQIGLIVVVDRYFEMYSEHFTDASKKRVLPAIVFVPSIDGRYLKRDLKGFLANVLGIKL